MLTSHPSPMIFKVIFIDLILGLGTHGSFQMQHNPHLKHIKMHLTSGKKKWIVSNMPLFKLK